MLSLSLSHSCSLSKKNKKKKMSKALAKVGTAANAVFRTISKAYKNPNTQDIYACELFCGTRNIRCEDSLGGREQEDSVVTAVAAIVHVPEHQCHGRAASRPLSFSTSTPLSLLLPDGLFSDTSDVVRTHQHGSGAPVSRGRLQRRRW